MFIADNKKNNKKGFTIIEMMIAISIFTLATLGILGIYVASLRASQKTLALNQAQQEAQLIMSALAKKVRFSQLDYQYYNDYLGGVHENESQLVLLDYDNKRYLFSNHDNSLYVKVDSGPEVAIPAQRINVESLNFVIRPQTSPFSLSAPPTDQPRVTITMTISTKTVNAPKMVIQQTTPQRLGGF